MAMPEEVNRIVTDAISDLFFVTEPAGVENLAREGKPADRVHFVGHVMIDNLFHQRDRLAQADPASFATTGIKRRLGRYGVVTLHRPSNVDDPVALRALAGALNAIAARLPLVFPVHPRTRANLERFGIELDRRIELGKPLSYMEFLNLWKDARLVLTDSGGLQEETTALGVPCVTLRENTERPITLTEGTNRLAGTSPERIVQLAGEALDAAPGVARRPALWDGQAAERTVAVLLGASRPDSGAEPVRTC
jgi:UDP-N-acetylglucosamine 2-epimerase (non-hydrolysing)